MLSVVDNVEHKSSSVVECSVDAMVEMSVDIGVEDTMLDISDVANVSVDDETEKSPVVLPDVVEACVDIRPVSGTVVGSERFVGGIVPVIEPVILSGVFGEERCDEGEEVIESVVEYIAVVDSKEAEVVTDVAVSNSGVFIEENGFVVSSEERGPKVALVVVDLVEFDIGLVVVDEATVVVV